MNYLWICWYWKKHTIGDKWKLACDCEKVFWYSEWELQKYILDKYWFYYPSRITSTMRKEYYDKKRELVKN